HAVLGLDPARRPVHVAVTDSPVAAERRQSDPKPPRDCPLVLPPGGRRRLVGRPRPDVQPADPSHVREGNSANLGRRLALPHDRLESTYGIVERRIIHDAPPRLSARRLTHYWTV